MDRGGALTRGRSDLGLDRVGASAPRGADRIAGGGYDPAVIFDAASDGLHIIVGMLIVGLVFLAVIGLGELAKAASHRRKARRPSSY